MKIVFMGTPDFARKSLEAIYNAGHEILAIVTNVDKPKGRGMKMIYTPVKEFAIEKNIQVYQPAKIRNNIEFIETISALKPDVLCVVAYGKILPKEVLDIPKYGAINVHGSLLPKYRGAAPIQWSIINGDTKTGVTTMFMDEGMDTGDMILKKEVSIREDETTGELWNELADVGANLLVETLKKIDEVKDKGEDIKWLIGAEKQGENFTTAPMLNKEMAYIDWNKSATQIHNLVRGLDPIMGTYTFYNEKKLKIWKTKVIENTEIIEVDRKFQNGQIVLCNPKQGLFVKTGDGIISILELQAENSKRMDIKSFLNGNEMKEGSIFR